MNHPDLRDFVRDAGPFLSIAIPTPSRSDDAAHQFEIRWKNALSQIAGAAWTPAEIADLEGIGRDLHHGEGAAVVILHRRDGATLVEFIDEPVRETTVDEGPLPRLAPLIEARQRVIAHVVVETDRGGADLTAFDGGSVLTAETVEGERLHIHRGHPGGWSQRRFQQRAENTWEENARLVAGETATLARRVDAELIVVSGEVRARSLLVDELDGMHDVPDVVGIESGSPEAIADEVVRLVADRVARGIRELAERVREGTGHGRATVDTAETLATLNEGRVATLLVHDDIDAVDEVTDTEIAGFPAGARTVDVAIAAALRSDADVVVVPQLAMMDGPLAAILRW
jgi:hypothetical protein